MKFIVLPSDTVTVLLVQNWLTVLAQNMNLVQDKLYWKLYVFDILSTS